MDKPLQRPTLTEADGSAVAQGVAGVASVAREDQRYAFSRCSSVRLPEAVQIAAIQTPSTRTRACPRALEQSGLNRTLGERRAEVNRLGGGRHQQIAVAQKRLCARLPAPELFKHLCRLKPAAKRKHGVTEAPSRLGDCFLVFQASLLES